MPGVGTDGLLSSYYSPPGFHLESATGGFSVVFGGSGGAGAIGIAAPGGGGGTVPEPVFTTAFGNVGAFAVSPGGGGGGGTGPLSA